jgi:hypothetical protein
LLVCVIFVKIFEILLSRSLPGLASNEIFLKHHAIHTFHVLLLIQNSVALSFTFSLN